MQHHCAVGEEAPSVHARPQPAPAQPRPAQRPLAARPPAPAAGASSGSGCGSTACVVGDSTHHPADSCLPGGSYLGPHTDCRQIPSSVPAGQQQACGWRWWHAVQQRGASRDRRALGGRPPAGVQLGVQAVRQRQRELHAAGAAAHHSDPQPAAAPLPLQRLRQQLLEALRQPAPTQQGAMSCPASRCMLCWCTAQERFVTHFCTADIPCPAWKSA